MRVEVSPLAGGVSGTRSPPNSWQACDLAVRCCCPVLEQTYKLFCTPWSCEKFNARNVLPPVRNRKADARSTASPLHHFAWERNYSSNAQTLLASTMPDQSLIKVLKTGGHIFHIKVAQNSR